MKSVHTLQNVLSGMNLGQIVYPASSLSCEACVEGKQHKTTFLNHRGRQTIKYFEIVHLDVCSPMRDVIFMDDGLNIRMIWKCVKVGEMRLPRWLGWTNLSNLL